MTIRGTLCRTRVNVDDGAAADRCSINSIADGIGFHDFADGKFQPNRLPWLQGMEQENIAAEHNWHRLLVYKTCQCLAIYPIGDADEQRLRLFVADHDLAGDYAEALTEIASDAVMLGTAPIWVIANATTASATYLAAANRAPAPGGPATGPLTGQPTGPLSGIDFSTGLPPLPPGVGTDAVLREWGYVRAPGQAGTDGPSGSEPSGIRTDVEPAVLQENSAEAAEPAEPEKSVEDPERLEFIAALAADGMVLLKNENRVLPLPPKASLVPIGGYLELHSGGLADHRVDVFVGGRSGPNARAGAKILEDVPCADLPRVLEQVIPFVSKRRGKPAKKGLPAFASTGT